jgi:hypothetical protein
MGHRQYFITRNSVAYTTYLVKQRNSDAGCIANMEETEDFCKAMFWHIAF